MAKIICSKCDLILPSQFRNPANEKSTKPNADANAAILNNDQTAVHTRLTAVLRLATEGTQRWANGG